MAPLFVCFPLKTVFLFCSVVKYQICKGCSMLLPNKCSFRAHLRIHAHKSPYCCPECGSLCRSADIQKHVRENCLHYARKAWYKWVTWQEMQVFFFFKKPTVYSALLQQLCFPFLPDVFTVIWFSGPFKDKRLISKKNTVRSCTSAPSARLHSRPPTTVNCIWKINTVLAKQLQSKLTSHDLTVENCGLLLIGCFNSFCFLFAG